MKKLLLILPIFIFAFNIKQEYFSHNYQSVCKYGMNHFQKHNENLLSFIGYSCIKSDNLFYLPTIINNLKYTKEGRKNSIYFATLLLEKKLLLSYILDNTDISYFRFPLLDHPISIVITNIINKNYKTENNIFTVNYKNKVYKVYGEKNSSKVFINVYQDNNLIETHWYR